MKLDYSITDLEGRKQFVNDLLESGEFFTPQQLGYMSDYLLFVADRKQTGHEKTEDYPIVTKNRNVTVSKRQISYEETVENLQNGEDGIYSMIIHDKNTLLDNRAPITQEDIETIPGIRENLDVIDKLKTQFAEAEGKRKFLL